MILCVQIKSKMFWKQIKFIDGKGKVEYQHKILYMNHEGLLGKHLETSWELPLTGLFQTTFSMNAPVNNTLDLIRHFELA